MTSSGSYSYREEIIGSMRAACHAPLAFLLSSQLLFPAHLILLVSNNEGTS